MMNIDEFYYYEFGPGRILNYQSSWYSHINQSTVSETKDSVELI